MKIIVLLLSLFIIWFRPPTYPPVCNIVTAKQAIPPRLFAEITIDSNTQNTKVTRFFHNKAGIFLSEFQRCYFQSFDLNYLNELLGPPGTLGYLYFIYRSFISKRITLIMLLLLLPAVPFFKQPQIIILIFDKLFASIGIILFLYFLKNSVAWKSTKPQKNVF